MNHFSLVVLKTTLSQQHKLLSQYKKEKSTLNWEGKEKISRVIFSTAENIIDLEKAIQIIEQEIIPTVGKKEVILKSNV